MFEIVTRFTNKRRSAERTGPIADRMKATGLYANGIDRVLSGEASAVQMWRDGELFAETMKEGAIRNAR